MYSGLSTNSSKDLNRPDPRNSSIGDLAAFLQSNVTSESEGLMPLDELFDFMMEILMARKPPPLEEISRLMAYMALWDCQEWAIIRWLWENVVADENYNDTRIRGAYLLRGNQTQMETLYGIGQMLLDKHPEIYAEIAEMFGISSEPTLAMSPQDFSSAVFRFFLSGVMMDKSVLALNNFAEGALESHSFLPACAFDGIKAPRTNNSKSDYDQDVCPYFRTTFTDRGYCATFNGGSYSKTYKVW